MKTRHLRLRAFTLIELLVVISIIAILAGLSMPAIQGAIEQAKKTQAASLLAQIRTAVVAYNTDYLVWPVKDNPAVPADLVYVSGTDWIKLSHTLNGGRNPITTLVTVNSTNIPNNRQIKFMEFTRKNLDSSGAVFDPTSKVISNPNYLRLGVDGNYDDILDWTSQASTDNSSLKTTTPIPDKISAGCAGYSINNGTAAKRAVPISTW